MDEFVDETYAAPAAPAQEPVGWCKRDGTGAVKYWRSPAAMADTPKEFDGLTRYGWEPLYTAAPAQKIVDPTDALIRAAEAHAAQYDDDDRQHIKTDVLNAFYAGSKFAAPAQKPAPDRSAVEYMTGYSDGKAWAQGQVQEYVHAEARTAEVEAIEACAAWVAAFVGADESRLLRERFGLKP